MREFRILPPSGLEWGVNAASSQLIDPQEEYDMERAVPSLQFTLSFHPSCGEIPRIDPLSTERKRERESPLRSKPAHCYVGVRVLWGSFSLSFNLEAGLAGCNALLPHGEERKEGRENAFCLRHFRSS